MSPHPLALLAAFLAAGIALADFLHLPPGVWLATGAGLTVVAVICLVQRKIAAARLTVALAFTLAGAGLMAVEKGTIERDRVRQFYDDGRVAAGDPVEVTGWLERAPERAPDGLFLALRVEQLRIKGQDFGARGTVWLFAPARDEETRARYEALDLEYGARLRVMVGLSRAEEFRNPGVGTVEDYLDRRGFDALGTVKSPLLIERLDNERVFLPLMWLYERRDELLARLNRLFSKETAGVLKAALLGNRYYLSHQIAERYREGGTFHVLVISGLHISFIGGVALLIARRLTSRRWLQCIAAILLLWAYALAVGAEAAVVRAALMFTLAALAPLLFRRAGSLNALGAAAIALLAWRPQDLFNPSFQLTFLSVLAIITLAWPLCATLKEVGAWRPTLATPYPPAAPRWWITLGEALYWSERAWRDELARLNYSCRLFKSPAATRLEALCAQRLLRYVAVAVIVSASVQLVLLPFLVVYFHRVSFASVALNIWVGALMAAMSLCALAAMALAPLGHAVAAPFIWLVEKLNWLMAYGVDPFKEAGVAFVRVPEYTGWAAAVYALYYAPLIFLAIALDRWNPLGLKPAGSASFFGSVRRAILAASVWAALLLIIIAHPLSAGWPDGKLRVDFLDVGQGDAALVTAPDGTTLLIDGGGRPRFSHQRDPEPDEQETEFERDNRRIGDAVVAEYLWWRGLDRVDYLLATHADADHINGLGQIARNFRVRAALVGRTPADNEEYARFAAAMSETGVPIYVIGRGDVLRFGQVEAQVLWPPHATDATAPSDNNASVVLRLSFGDKTFLLTGDIESSAETQLSAQPAALHCDVVKVAHHGSRTSSTPAFVNAARARFAVVSVGMYSVFGHPHREVIERWRARGAKVLMTGACGTITFTTDGHDLQLETFVRQNGEP
jgi:competence protein ComEC